MDFLLSEYIMYVIFFTCTKFHKTKLQKKAKCFIICRVARKVLTAKRQKIY